MRPSSLTLLSVAVLIPSLRADSTATAIVAAMRLGEAANYSWTTAITDDAGTYEIEGKTESTGYTWQRQPMPPVIARRLGREAGYDLEAIFKGPQTYVIHTEGGWRRLDELPKRHQDWHDYHYAPRSYRPVIRTPDLPANELDVDPLGIPRHVYVQLPDADDDSESAYSNAQFALGLPHEQLSLIVSSHDQLTVEDGLATGTLTDLGARLLLVHDGHEYIHPITAGGRFKFRLNGPNVEKFTIELAGVVLVSGKTIYVRQTSTTVIRAIGRTAVTVPTEALRRL